MRNWCEMEPGRWRGIAAVLAALALALSLGACEAAVSNGTGGSLSEDELAALAAEVGPDWAIVEEYRKSREEWMKRTLEGLGSQEESAEASDGAEVDVESERPDISRAAAAAIAILEHEGGHEKRGAAARFLVIDGPMVPEGDELAYRGAKALFDGDAEVQGWPMLLVQMDMSRRFSGDGQSTRPAIDRFFEELASDAEDPRHRAAGRLYLASGLRNSLNAASLSAEERAARRESALEAATGLSAGVEDESLVLASGVRTFAEAEDDLIQTIRHATVGATPLDVVGVRLDGAEEALSDYRGRVVLLDFWATWCKPCIASLPDLRRMAADLPEERFVLLAISVDAQLETATGFMETEPMPFAHWYVGTQSDVTRILDVNSFPTYILLDEQGEIVARTNTLLDDFVSLVEETVEGASEV
jgi:thiol-disulfide isomerase/thioredoxin